MNYLISYEDFEILAKEQGIETYLVWEEQKAAASSTLGTPVHNDYKRKKVTAIFSGEKERRNAVESGSIKAGSLIVLISGRDMSENDITPNTRLSYQGHLYQVQVIGLARHRGKIIFYRLEAKRTEDPMARG